MTLNLSAEAFLSRYLAHVPVPRLQVLRGYGLYGQRQSARLNTARTALGQPAVEEPPVLLVEEFLARFKHTPEPASCPHCGAPLLYSSPISRATGPPALPH
jgi:hypothetical protein